MNYANIKYNDIANGPGIRTSLFVSGCRHHCKNCFNKETWNFLFGSEFTEQTLHQILASLNSDYIDGFSLLGGEPFEPENQQPLAYILHYIKSIYPNKQIWCWTGCLYDQDLQYGGNYYTSFTDDMLDNIDVLIDGPFVEELKDLNLHFRGSSNQRVIDVKKSKIQGKIVTLE